MNFLKYMLLMLLLLPATARAGDIAADIQKQYENLVSFSADFNQTLTNAASGESEKRSGQIHFKKPQYILWRTETPEPEILIVGKEAVWDYFPAEQTAYKYTKDEILGSKTVLRFISGEAHLKEEFYVEEEQTGEGGVTLKLIPRNPEPAMVEAALWVKPDKALITKVLVIDFYANKNLVELENLILNPDLSDGMFDFEPPPGVDVFDNTR